MKSILDNKVLASQPTLSRFNNQLYYENIKQIEAIIEQDRHFIYGLKTPKHVILNINFTLCETFGKQEYPCLNFHYLDNGYHPLLCYASIDLLKTELRKKSATLAQYRGTTCSSA